MSVGNRKKISVSFIFSSLKNLLHRSSILFLILVSIILLILSKSENDEISRFRTITLNYVAPIVDFFVSPVNAYYSFKDTLLDIVFVYDSNQNLKVDNKKLQEINDIVFFLKNENRRLKDELNYVKDPDVKFHTARIIGDSSSLYKRQGIINAGAAKGIRKGQVVVSNNNLIGRIQYIGNKSSKVLFLTDINSHIPVLLSKSQENAIVAGNNNNQLLKLHYSAEDAEIKKGESVYTSGDGMFFPAGIKVGTIYEIEKNNITVRPSADFYNLDYVRIVDISPVEDPEISTPIEAADQEVVK